MRNRKNRKTRSNIRSEFKVSSCIVQPPSPYHRRAILLRPAGCLSLSLSLSLPPPCVAMDALRENSRLGHCQSIVAQSSGRRSRWSAHSALIPHFSPLNNTSSPGYIDYIFIALVGMPGVYSRGTRRRFPTPSL